MMMFREVFERFSALWSALVVPAMEVSIHKVAHSPPRTLPTKVSGVITT